ncbi:MAG TPA: DUF5107 domain-containing protein [Chloroflexia bacterium]|nr:DUF5107 domain-containing protein [Chloroflexia bacterium]
MRRNLKKKLVPCATALAALVLLAAPLAAGTGRYAEAQSVGRMYVETGKTLAPEFVRFFDANGGVPLLGYPLTDPETEGGFEVQYLERARIEYHPENTGTPYEVQLGLLGSIQTVGRQFAPASSDVASSTPTRLYFPETQHSISGQFLDYWQANGGLALFGYPISEPVTENGLTVQYFQRNRFELHPEAAGTPYEVALGLLGRDMLEQRVKVTDSNISLKVYGYEEGFYTPDGDPIAPYPRLDLAKMGPLKLRSYRLIVLENRFLRLSIIPQLGGRLYEVVYKPTGHDELYRNPIVKPAPFSDKGWWLGAGGTEWAAPTDEHGLMEYLPWDAEITRNSDAGATVNVSATDKKTGMKVTVGITLSPEESAYTIAAKMENFTNKPQQGQLWTNAMVAPGGTNHVPADLKWILPTNQVVVHSTHDTGLPAEHGVVSWPQYNDRDLSNSATWGGWLGGFALPSAERGEFAAVYNSEADEGLVKSFSNKTMSGLKFFGWGPGVDPSIYTDDDSSYAELWGGITPTFWDYATFPPNSGLGWVERWQPVAHTGGVSLASAWGTVSVSGHTVNILPVRRIEGATLVVHTASGATSTYGFSAEPDRPASVGVSGEPTEIEVVGADGTSLLKGVPVR